MCDLFPREGIVRLLDRGMDSRQLGDSLWAIMRQIGVRYTCQKAGCPVSDMNGPLQASIHPRAPNGLVRCLPAATLSRRFFPLRDCQAGPLIDPSVPAWRELRPSAYSIPPVQKKTNQYRSTASLRCSTWDSAGRLYGKVASGRAFRMRR